MEKAAAAKAAMEKASQAALCQETAATEEAGQAALPTAAKGTEAEKEAVAEKEALAETLPDALATDAAASLAVTLATPVASPVAVALPPGPSSGSAPAPHGDVQCCACREVFPRDKCTCVNKGRLTTKCGDFQWRCLTCAAMMSRINRLKGGMFDAEGYKDLSIEERQKLMAEASSLYGGQLAAKLVETISKSQLIRSSMTFKVGGDFEKLTDVQERYKDNPTKWAEIQEKANKHTCGVTGEKLIQIPQYSLVKTNEDIQESLKKRKIEGDANIKNKKMQKAPRIKAEATEGQVDVQVAISENIMKRLEKTLNNMNAACPKIEGVRCKLAAPDAADAVPRHFTKKLDDGRQELLDTKKLAEELIAAKTGTKGVPTQVCVQGKEIIERVDALTTKIDGLIDDSKEL